MNIKELASKVFGFPSKMCDRDYKTPLTQEEYDLAMTTVQRVRGITEGYIGVSEFLLAKPPSVNWPGTRKWYFEYLNTADAAGYLPTEEEWALSFGLPTNANSLLAFPAKGTHCLCCLGTRIWAALLVGIFIGWLI